MKNGADHVHEPKDMFDIFSKGGGSGSPFIFVFLSVVGSANQALTRVKKVNSRVEREI